ncbi:transmembrane protein [Ceratobasidium sp. AG-Ba]|nr:transmembrane protein [Ceratobasidium sp. AG-Ba]
MDKSVHVPADWTEQVSALLESSAQLQRTAAQLLAHVPRGSYVSLPAPQSAQPSVLGAGVPIPSQGWKKDHSPKDKILARTKARLMKDGWEDCEDTDMHAMRLTEAMLRLGMEDMDNFMTEASRLNCSNMAISV